ncbi:GntR family transcriptional regulator [Paraburkholderia caledonica]|jgi:DNA-binding GntR family transcriptional regulator|uniref:GntR family transcriptional regulator n=1 Tax=Paraburkholderia caledonica TaxID=134536 RepID=UPI000DF01DDE|nr:GntR family transcriptional regulator [Paraburkholderia caledonica]AXF17505.1 GntR family transcriptional regulator [Paraburkholderia caledonica]
MSTRNLSPSKPPIAANAGSATLAEPRARRRAGAQAGVHVPLPDLIENVSFDSHEPIGKQIFRALRQAIFVGQMVPGTPLSEKEVSDMFQVSRQPVREAFIKLVEAGVLQVLPQRGTFVKRISPRQVREGRFIREAIETAVVRKAAVSITDEQLQALADNLREQKLAAKSNDTAAFLALDEAFHYAISQAIDCTAAWETIQDIKAQMDRVRYLSLPDVSPLDLLIRQHAKILAGLRAHDPIAAEDAMRSHLREILVSLGPIAARNPAWFETDEPERVPLST